MLKVRPLRIFLPKMSVYRRDFAKTKCMSFLIKDKKFVRKIERDLEKRVTNIIKERI